MIFGQLTEQERGVMVMQRAELDKCVIMQLAAEDRISFFFFSNNRAPAEMSLI